MVARTDLRPTRADDLLKKIRQGAVNPQTRPHGVKVAQPGEYVSFYDTDGSAHRWDGDAIAEYDTRLAEGAAAVAEAQAHLAEVEADLEEAKERITASNGDLTLYVQRVEAAQATADAANAALQTLTSELETAQSAVDAVANRTSAVESAVVEADSKAAQAASDANAAKDAAANALAAAQQVQADAQNALSKAEEAEDKALEAAGIAAGKGKIIYAASEPSGAEASTSNLWIRSSDSKPHRWDGSRWVEVTDKAILDAASAAQAAQSTATKAVADAAAAQAAADTAQAAADTAQAAAQTADAKAANAASAANAAQTTANKAVSDASTAQAAANAADAKALSAAGVANGKGKVIYSTTAPGTADRLTQNLWVRLPDNAPHRWSGSAWVAVTDKTATDAAQAAANAQSAANTAKATADKAVADAAAASTQAQNALTRANQAQSSADGKSTVTYTSGSPAGVGVRVGDTHYKVDTSGTVLSWWRWDGSAWKAQAIDGQVIASLDAGKITSGYLDVANRIKAGDIHADKLLIGIGDNLLPPLRPDSELAYPGVATLDHGTFTLPPSTGKGSYLSSVWGGEYRVRIDPGKTYRVGVTVSGGAGGRAQLYVRFVTESGSWIFGKPSNILGVPDGGVLQGDFTPPDNGTLYTRMLIGFYTNGTTTTPMVFSNPFIRELKDGSLIVNGSITGEKVNAESVAAAVGSFVKVNAENVTVTNELAARVVNAMTAQVKNLVVTESAILQHTTLLGETVAEQLNVTKKLVARDAIVNGTLDVEQLNVTGDMAAQIVSAMSVESKKLIVTEDAILNRATVVQSLVTPELVAQKISSALITGSTIQTSAATNSGVKIDSSGYKAYDSNGNLAVNLDGKDNRVVGSFATSYDDASGVKITQKSTAAAIDLYTPNWGGNASYRDSHAGIWFEVPSNLSNRKLNIIATDNKDTSRNDPGMLLWPGSGIGFQGRFISDSPAWKMGKLTSSSLAPGASADWDITFSTAMTGSQPAIFPMITNGANAVVSYVVTQQSNSGFHLRVKNTDTFATGSVMVIWWAVGTNILNI